MLGAGEIRPPLFLKAKFANAKRFIKKPENLYIPALSENELF